MEVEDAHTSFFLIARAFRRHVELDCASLCAASSTSGTADPIFITTLRRSAFAASAKPQSMIPPIPVRPTLAMRWLRAVAIWLSLSR